MNKIQKTIIALFLIIGIFNATAQKEFTVEADSATSDMIFRKFMKYKFAKSIGKDANPFRYLNNDYNSGEVIYGAYVIQQKTYALGKWAKKPDYKVYKSFFKNPWKGYSLYYLDIPRCTPNNEVIAGLTTPKKEHEKRYGYLSIDLKNIVAYNHKTGDLKDVNFYSLSKFYKKSEIDIFQKMNPNYEMIEDTCSKKILLIDPVNDYQLEEMLKSELLKNIYSYRFAKSGIFDSLFTPEGYIKEDVTLFPLVDKLLPDFDEELLMRCDFVEKTDGYKS